MKANRYIILTAVLLLVGCATGNFSNLTEPKPVHTNYYKVVLGGLAIDLDKNEICYKLILQVIKEIKNPYYLTILYENPINKATPIKQEIMLDPGVKELTIKSPPVKGLRIYSEYKVTVKTFSDAGRKTYVDILSQEIRSYADNTGDKTYLMKGLKQAN